MAEHRSGYNLRRRSNTQVPSGIKIRGEEKSGNVLAYKTAQVRPREKTGEVLSPSCGGNEQWDRGEEDIIADRIAPMEGSAQDAHQERTGGEVARKDGGMGGIGIGDEGTRAEEELVLDATGLHQPATGQDTELNARGDSTKRTRVARTLPLDRPSGTPQRMYALRMRTWRQRFPLRPVPERGEIIQLDDDVDDDDGGVGGSRPQEEEREGTDLPTAGVGSERVRPNEEEARGEEEEDAHMGGEERREDEIREAAMGSGASEDMEDGTPESTGGEETDEDDEDYIEGED